MMNGLCFDGNPLKEKLLQSNVQTITNNVFWCQNCNIPLLTERCYNCNSTGKYCGTNLKPTFAEERLFFEEKIRNQLNVNLKLPENLLRGHANRVIYNGKTLFRFSSSDGTIELKNINLNILSDRSDISFDDFYQRAFIANLPILISLERESILFIKKIIEEFANNKKYILFSGGKDSTLVATIVKKAIGNVPLFFSNTTIELEDTLKYIDEFSKNYKLEVISQKSDKNFLNVCNQLGPPSHIMRWCCTVFKSYPVNMFLNTVEGDILTFDGIRKAESPTRSRYPRIYKNLKIPRQTVARPIFYWPTLAVWLYLLKNRIMFNPAYNKGFSRIGCYPCPFNSKYDQVLLKHYYSNEYLKWEEFLINFSKEHNKGLDLKWVKNGYWKQRKPDKKREKSVLEKNDENTLIYNFQDAAINKDILEFLKPFGDVEFLTHNSFQINGYSPFIIRGMIGGPQLKINFMSKMFDKDVKRLRRQIEKSLNCIGCGGCTGLCPKGAIITNGKFSIDNKKCIHCSACVNSNFTTKGCISLSYKEDTKRVYNLQKT
jgi:phosphoadenosine phosphosulfate reductase